MHPAAAQADRPCQSHSIPFTNEVNLKSFVFESSGGQVNGKHAAVRSEACLQAMSRVAQWVLIVAGLSIAYAACREGYDIWSQSRRQKSDDQDDDDDDGSSNEPNEKKQLNQPPAPDHRKDRPYYHDNMSPLQILYARRALQEVARMVR